MFGDMDQSRKHPRMFIAGIVILGVVGLAATVILSF